LFDLAIGNVPFGGYGVADRRYDKHRFNIHDYFFAKTLDQVRPGGVIAFVTSQGTMDKRTPDVRKYIAERAELLGAVRLPNNAFLKNAGTEVTTDIVFLQKRDRVIDIAPDWIHLGHTQTAYPSTATSPSIPR
jgi:adenine-specific DNA methylase